METNGQLVEKVSEDVRSTEEHPEVITVEIQDEALDDLHKRSFTGNDCYNNNVSNREFMAKHRPLWNLDERSQNIRHRHGSLPVLFLKVEPWFGALVNWHYRYMKPEHQNGNGQDLHRKAWFKNLTKIKGFKLDKNTYITTAPKGVSLSFFQVFEQQRYFSSTKKTMGEMVSMIRTFMSREQDPKLWVTFRGMNINGVIHCQAVLFHNNNDMFTATVQDVSNTLKLPMPVVMKFLNNLKVVQIRFAGAWGEVDNALPDSCFCYAHRAIADSLYTGTTTSPTEIRKFSGRFRKFYRFYQKKNQRQSM